jgi:hypothetical protein
MFPETCDSSRWTTAPSWVPASAIRIPPPRQAMINLSCDCLGRPTAGLCEGCRHRVYELKWSHHGDQHLLILEPFRAIPDSSSTDVPPGVVQNARVPLAVTRLTPSAALALPTDVVRLCHAPPPDWHLESCMGTHPPSRIFFSGMPLGSLRRSATGPDALHYVLPRVATSPSNADMCSIIRSLPSCPPPFSTLHSQETIDWVHSLSAVGGMPLPSLPSKPDEFFLQGRHFAQPAPSVGYTVRKVVHEFFYKQTGERKRRSESPPPAPRPDRPPTPRPPMNGPPLPPPHPVSETLAVARLSTNRGWTLHLRCRRGSRPPTTPSSEPKMSPCRP